MKSVHALAGPSQSFVTKFIAGIRNWSRPIFLWLFTFLVIQSPTARAQTHPCVLINCPGDITVECESLHGTPVVFKPVAQSACDQRITTKCIPPSGTEFPPGTNRVACETTDALGRTARCEFNVIVTC